MGDDALAIKLTALLGHGALFSEQLGALPFGLNSLLKIAHTAALQGIGKGCTAGRKSGSGGLHTLPTPRGDPQGDRAIGTGEHNRLLQSPRFRGIQGNTIEQQAAAAAEHLKGGDKGSQSNTGGLLIAFQLT